MRFLKAEPMWKTDVKRAIFTPEKNTYIILTSQYFARVPLLGNALKWLNLISRPSYNTPRIIIFWWRAQNSAKRPPTGHSSGIPTGSHHDSLSTWKFDPTFLSNLVCGHQMLIVVLSALTTRPVLEAGCYIYDRLGQLNKIKSLSFPSPLYWIGLTQQRRADQIARRWYRYFRK